MQNDKNCEVINFAEFKHEMDRMLMNPTERTIDDLLQIIKMQGKHIGTLIKMVKNTEDRVHDINKQIYEMFPDIEIIDTMADTEEEKAEMYKLYLNRNDDWDK